MTALAGSAEQAAVDATGFEVRIRPARDAVWVEPVGELDLCTVPELREQIEELLAVGFERVIIDLRGLSFIDVSGLKLLLCLTGEARAAGRRLSLIQGSDVVRRIFALTGTLEQLPFLSAAGR